MSQRTFLIVAALGFVLASCAPRPMPALAADRAKVMEGCEASFGPPVDRENALFEVDHDFVLEAGFDENGRLERLAVQPKHWFGKTHPEWDESEDVGELTVPQYEALLGRLDGIWPKGRLVTPDAMPVVKETTLRRRDVYEHAVVVTGDVVDDTRPEDVPRTVKYLLVYPTVEADASSAGPK